MKAKQLGSVVFEYPQEAVRERAVLGEKRNSAAGTKIIHESANFSPDISLVSATDDWLSSSNIEDIMAMSEQIDTPFTIVYTDNSTEDVVFDHTKDVSFSEITEGVCFYHGTIPLIKIN